jgi:exodeoxyribonuclease VII large subunit
MRCMTARMDEKRRHLAQTARILPRAEQLFAGSKQRLDFAGGRLDSGLRRNLQKHARDFTKSSARFRKSLLTSRFAQARERNAALVRVLESVSFPAVLERGFVLVRGEGGKIRRRAEAVLAGETLALTFADGTRTAVAEGSVAPKMKKRAKKSDDEQDSLF